MRTTIDLPDDLLAEAKARAARERRTMSAVIGDAVRASFSRSRPSVRQPVDLPTYGEGGLLPGVDLDDTASLLDLMERDG